MSCDPPSTPPAGLNEATPSEITPSKSDKSVVIEDHHLTRTLSAPADIAHAKKRSQRTFGPLFKAYAFRLRSEIWGGAGDMWSDEQAFFASTSMQQGVPMKMHDAYLNSRVFALADAIQTERSPTLIDGGRSFVKYLESYLDHVEDSSRTDEEKLRNAQEKYTAIKREASLQFELAEFKWKEALQRDPTMTLDKWIDKYGYDYLDACEERDWAKKNLRRAQQTGSKDVLRQKDLMESALNSQSEVPGQVTPLECCPQELIRDAGRQHANKGDPSKDLVYRPLHVLPGSSFMGDDWANRGLGEGDDVSSSSMVIDLRQGVERTWEELGFPQLDGTEKSFNNKDKDIICSIIRDWKMTLKYTDMHAFDVNRGLWNIPGFRSILPELARTAPSHLKDKVFQTSRILLAYNVDLVLRLPQELFTKLFPRTSMRKTAAAGKEVWVTPTTSALSGLEDELLSELFQTFPFAKLHREAGDGDYELHVRGQRNNLYPTVLGVLARKV